MSALLAALADQLEAQAQTNLAQARAIREMVTTPTSPDDMLTVREAAAVIKRSASFVRAKCQAGRIKAMADGLGYRIRRSALEAYERRNTR